MSENTNQSSAQDPLDPGTDDANDAVDAQYRESSGRDPVRIAAWIGLAASVLIGLFTLIRFYWAATATIESLVQPDLVDPFIAGFNLALLLVACAASLKLVRVLAGDVELF